ncbi:hypothetical protein [Streptomyces sp. NPDC052107]|uniref:hypothetical protein n=1 Tax=Streptomyces sp. NPDC052107 TaxID=3155632 RepID=UPI003449C4F0
MITFQFTVRPGQGDPHGFDMGDMVVTGDFDAVDSVGHVPDQGMMIYLSVVQLLDDEQCSGPVDRPRERCLAKRGGRTFPSDRLMVTE